MPQHPAPSPHQNPPEQNQTSSSNSNSSNNNNNSNRLLANRHRLNNRLPTRPAAAAALKESTPAAAAANNATARSNRHRSARERVQTVTGSSVSASTSSSTPAFSDLSATSSGATSSGATTSQSISTELGNQHQQHHHHHQQQQQQQQKDPLSEEYKLLLSPMFAAMTKITDHLFLTGVGGMTRENFRKNHIDFVVNITTEAPFWEDVESMRLPLEDDPNTNILPHLDTAVDRIHEAIVKRNAHVLVHCFAGVSRSATIVIAYLMKQRRMDLRSAFNYCYNLRPVIRPNNGFMLQLINYEHQLFGKSSVWMIDVDVESTLIRVPQFFLEEHPNLVILEVIRVRELQKQHQQVGATSAATPASHNTKPPTEE